MSNREMLQPPVGWPFAAMVHSPCLGWGGGVRVSRARGGEVGARSAPPSRADGGLPGLGAVTNASYSVWDGTQEIRGRLRACPPGNARLGIGRPHHRRGRLRRASLSAPCREVPWRGDKHRMPDLPPVPAHPRDLRVWGRTRAIRRPGEAGARTSRDGHGIWGVPGVRRRGLPELWLEPPRLVLRSWHGRAARPARPAWVTNSEQDELKFWSGQDLSRGVRQSHEARWRTGTTPCTARYGEPRWVDYPRPDWLIQTSEGRVSNPDIPYAYRPGRGGSSPSRDSSDGYAAASQAGSRGLDERSGYGRGSGRSGGGGRHGGHSNRSSRGSLRGGGSPRRGGTAAADGTRGGVREDYAWPDPTTPPKSPRRGGGPDQDGPSHPGSRDGGATPWGERSARSRATSKFGTGVRDIRDDLRERLRRNGVRGDWDQQGGHRSRHSGNGNGDWGGPDGPDGKQPRRKGSWWRHWSWKKVLTIVAALVGLMIITAMAGVAYAYSKTPIPDVQTAVMQQASKVYFSDGKTEVGQFGQTNRVILTYNQFPSKLRDAVVAAEDKNFWHEGGISVTGIVRAAYYDLTSSGGNLQGGSTITQQLVRNYYDDIGTAQTASRKINEIFVAQKLAQAKSNQWILQQYLNTVYFGGGAYGAAAAAQVYFGLDPSHLSKITAAQAAMIAAMIQAPSYYKPDPNAGAAHAALEFRWKYVLRTMESMGTLSPQDYSAAVAKFPAVVPPMSNTWNGYQGYIMQAVLNELESTYHYTLGQINTTGLHVVTTFNQNLMKSLYSTVRQADTLMKHCTTPALLASQAHTACTKLPHWVRTGAVLEDVHNGAILAMYSGPNYNGKDCHCQFDNALQSRNQVGSSFKTYVLATAVKQGMNVQTSILDGDSPLWIPPDSSPALFAKPGSQSPGPGYYKVVNDESGRNSFGPTHVQEATALSLNTAYTDLWHKVAYDPTTGRHPVTDMAKAFGVDVKLSGMVGGPSPMQDEAGIALGQASLTAEEQATTIATLADNGMYHTPHVIKKIIAGNSVTPAKVTTRQVLTTNQAADVAWALSADTTAGGTAAGLGLT